MSPNKLFNTDITVSGSVTSVSGVFASGDFSQSLTISGTPVNIDFSSGFRGALIWTTSGTSLSTEVAQILAWDNVAYDTDGFFNPVEDDNRFVVPAGVNKVRLYAQLRYENASASGDRRIIFRKNNNGSLALGPEFGQIGFMSNMIATMDTGDHTYIQANTAIISVEEGDNFQMRARQGSGITLSTHQDGTWFGIEVVDPTAAQNPAEVFAVSGTYTTSLTVSGVPVNIGGPSESQFVGSNVAFIRDFTVETADSATITISDIPQNASNLLIQFSLRASNANENTGARIRFNGDSTANYDTAQHLLANGAISLANNGYGDTEGGLGVAAAANAPAGNFCTGDALVADYSNSLKNTAYRGTSYLDRVSTTEIDKHEYMIFGGTFTKTDVVTSINIINTNTSNWAVGTKVTVYGYTDDVIAANVSTVTAASGTFTDSLTVSGTPVHAGDPLTINELVAATGTFTEGLTVGTGSTIIDGSSIATSAGTFDTVSVAGTSISSVEVGPSIEHALIVLSADQTTNIDADTGDHVEFDTISGTSGISISTGAGQVNGLITLPANKTFYLESGLAVDNTDSGGDTRWRWRNNTEAAFIGMGARTRPASNVTAGKNHAHVARALLSTTAVTEVEVQLTDDGFNKITGIRGGGLPDAGDSSWVWIQEMPSHFVPEEFTTLSGNFSDSLTVSGIPVNIGAGGGAAPTTISGIIGNKLGLTHSPAGLWLFDGNLNDSSGNGLDLTKRAGTELYMSNHGLTCLKFDQVAAYAHTPTGTALEITGDITVELLLSVDLITSQGYLLAYSSDLTGSSAHNVLYSLNYTVGTELLAALHHSGSESQNNFDSTAAGIDALHHLVMVRESGNYTIYMDGKQIGDASTGLTPAAGGTSSFFQLGSLRNSFKWTGSIACVKIIASALTESQVYDEFKTTWATLV